MAPDGAIFLLSPPPTAPTPDATYINSILPFGRMLLTLLNVAVSVVLISVLFAAVYKVLPDRHLEWRDVAIGAIARRSCSA